MPEYLSPGVYVEERDTGSKPIEGVSTSTTGMVGISERGPVNVPILITSYGEFTRWFGERLNINDFSNDNGAHCYLPHAVEGFFTNGGKRLYVIRVQDTVGATLARRFLFDRGAVTSADTTLLRTANERTGTVANMPLLYVLDVTDINVNDWIRIDTGSNAEYRQVAAVGTAVNNTHVPLNNPLSFSHNDGETVDQFSRTEDITANGGQYSAGFTLRADTDAGDDTILIQGAGLDIDVLELAASTLIEIGGANTGEYHFVSEVNVTDTTEARVRLSSTLVVERAGGDAVIPLQQAAVNTANLALAPSAGSRLIFVDNRGGNFDDRTTLVFIDNTVDNTHREVRRIGELSELTLSTGTYEEYGAGTLVEVVMMADDDRDLTAIANISDTTITLNDVTGLAVGDSLVVGVVGSEETVVIQRIDTVAITIDLTSAITIGHGNGDPVVPVAKTLTSGTSDGSSVVALNNRLGLSVGDVLRIGNTPDDEYLTISLLPNISGVAPDAGNVIFEQALARDHANGVEVRRQNPPTPAALQATVLTIEAEADDTTLIVTDGNNYAQDAIIRITTASTEEFYHRLSTNVTSSAPAEVTLAEALGRAHGAGSTIVEREQLISVQALDAGAWGNRLRISVENEETGLISRTTLNNIINPTHIRLASAAGVEVGTILELLDPLNDNHVVGEPLKVVFVDRSSNYTITIAGTGLSAEHQAAEAAAVATGSHLSVRSSEFRITVLLLRQPDSVMPSRNEIVIDQEIFRHLSLDPRHGRYIEKIIGTTWIPGASDDNAIPPRPLRSGDRRSEGESGYIRVYDRGKDALGAGEPNATLESIRLGPETLVDILPSGNQRPARHSLEGGDDSIVTVTNNTYVGIDDREPENRTGIQSLRNEDEISIVACPGQISPVIQGALINHCERMRYRFAVLDGPVPPRDTINDAQDQRQQFDTKYAAIYHPWLLVRDPFPNNLATVMDFPIPPSGHTMGVYARTDTERGVHKAPANEVVKGIIGLRRILNKSEHDILNPYPVNINVTRDFRPNFRGIRVWGGRVITSDPDWKYVNVRRLFIFIESSIDRGLQWVVFEPNAEPLWARVRRTISNFLTAVWRNGALEGTNPEEAFFVKCDRTTMTQTDIDNGRLICVIGVAPVKPAEFVIIRIGLWTAFADDNQ